MRQVLDKVEPEDLQVIAGDHIKMLSEEGYLKPYELNPTFRTPMNQNGKILFYVNENSSRRTDS